ncbi:PREDICTED: protein enabled-like [Rhagoletis zephyria]|uniref:protein enabled-like n=1 Tax=Rhagoletis zephyria TaxID=28612 RepID=UPI000811A344|nr:PREDICTED: protein enabled-like [Rhagoletis zephyria]
MLDRKIEEGPDYDSSSETEIALEEARLNALVQHWESASLTASICSSASRSLQTTPIRQAPVKQLATTRTVMQPTVAVPVPMPMPVQQPVLATDFLTHGASPTAAQLSAAAVAAGGTLKHHQGSQQIVISHMNTKMLHQLAVVPQMPISMTPETSATTANTSNALALLQASNQTPQPQYTQHLLSSSSPQLLGNIKSNVSPKRLIDGRLLMNSSPLAQQMHTVTTPLPSAYISGSAQQTAAAVASAGNSYANGGANSGCSSQPTMPMQLAYFGQPPQMHQQMQQQYQQQQHQTSNAAMAMATMTMTGTQNDQQTPQGQSQPYYGDQIQMHAMQPPTEYKFPPAISVQRLAPQVQRQLRETQELIKDSCPQLFAAGYGGSPGPPIRNQAKNPNRRPTLETQFSQESS